MLPLFCLILLGSLFFHIRDTAAMNYCGAVGAYFKVSTSCVKGNTCVSGSVDLTKMKPIIPSQYEYVLNSLCGEGEVCCADQGTSLCVQATKIANVQGSCETSCGAGMRDFSSSFSGAPELCSNGSCCVRSGSVTPESSAPTVHPTLSFAAFRNGFSVTPVASAAEAAPTPGYGLINPLGSRSIPSLIADFIKLLSGISGTLFLVFLLWGGMQWMTAGGDSKKTLAARNRILYSILGIAIIFLAYFIVDALIGVTNIPF
jgi:hypothetical protein